MAKASTMKPWSSHTRHSPKTGKHKNLYDALHDKQIQSGGNVIKTSQSNRFFQGDSV